MKKIFLLLIALLLPVLAACGSTEPAPQIPAMTTEDAVAQFLSAGDMTAAAHLLDNKETYPLLNGEDIRGQMSYEWVQLKRVYKSTDEGLSSVYTYKGTIKLNRDGTGETRSPGNEPLSWHIDGDSLYFKTTTDGVSAQGCDPKYRYEVREVCNDGTVFGTVYGLYGTDNNTLILFVHPDSELAK